MMKKLFKYAIPITIVVQLLIIIVSVRADKALQCKMVSPYLICRQITPTK